MSQKVPPIGAIPHLTTNGDPSVVVKKYLIVYKQNPCSVLPCNLANSLFISSDHIQRLRMVYDVADPPSRQDKDTN